MTTAEITDNKGKAHTQTIHAAFAMSTGLKRYDNFISAQLLSVNPFSQTYDVTCRNLVIYHYYYIYCTKMLLLLIVIIFLISYYHYCFVVTR